jgi:tetratricopeptide (TPR) repeat protein
VIDTDDVEEHQEAGRGNAGILTDAPGQDKHTPAASRRFRYSALVMLVGIRLACGSFVAAALCACTGAGLGPPREAGAADSPAQLQASGDAALERKDFPLAASYYRQAAERADDEQVAEQATRVAYDNQQQREAAAAAERWLQLNPTSEQARRYAGVAALQLHRLDTAEEHFASLLETAYLSPAAGFLALYPVIAEEGTPADVTELFRRLGTRYPKVAEGQYALAGAALRSENFALASEAASRAVQLAAFWAPARMLLARTMIATGQDEQGIALALEVVTDNPSDIGSHLEYALLLSSIGRDEEARAVLTPYATGTTVVPGALRALGLLDLQNGDLDAATTRFDALLATGAQTYESLFHLGAIAEEREDTERALRSYARVTGGDFALAAQVRVARIKAEKSGTEAGLLHLEEFARTNPEFAVDVIAQRAALLSARDDERGALEELDAGIERYPDSVELRMARVFLLERTDRVDASVRELRQLLKERPGDAVIQNALGYTLADRTRQYDEAHTLIASALTQTPDSAAVLDSMGWVLFRQDRPREALPYLRRARELASDPEIDLHLGEALWAVGDQAEARRTWQAALERSPDYEKLRERLERAGP